MLDSHSSSCFVGSKHLRLSLVSESVMDLEMRVRIRAQATLTPHVGKTSLRYCFTGLAWLWWVRRGIVLACVWSLGCATMSIRMEGTSRVPKIVGTASDSQDLETLVRSMDSLMA